MTDNDNEPEIEPIIRPAAADRGAYVAIESDTIRSRVVRLTKVTQGDGDCYYVYLSVDADGETVPFVQDGDGFDLAGEDICVEFLGDGKMIRDRWDSFEAEVRDELLRFL